MHYAGFVFVTEPTDAALAAAMASFYEKEWDWFRVGGRWDGYLVSDVEMKDRETHNGFNFDPANKDISRNNCLAQDLPDDRRRVAFFVADGQWMARKEWNGEAWTERETFASDLERALAEQPDRYVVIVDAHN